MPYNRSDKRRAKRVNVHNLIIWLAALAFLCVYFGGYLYGYINRQRVATGEVMPGSSEDTYIFSAVCVREETVYFADTPGAVSIVTQAGERVKKGSAVCAITDAGELAAVEDGLAMVDEAIMKNADISKSPFAPDIEKLDEGARGDIIASAYNLGGGRFDGVYALMDRLAQTIDTRRQILSFGATTDSKQLARERSLFEARLDSAKRIVYAAEGGIVSYMIDGAEGVYDPARVMAMGADIIRFNPPTAAHAQNVAVGEPVCRVVTSNTWYIAAVCDTAEAAEGWQIGDYLEFCAEGAALPRPVNCVAVIKEIVPREAGVYVLLELRSYLETFMDSRVITLTTTANRAEGLKIPLESITRKTLLSIPKAYTFEKDEQTYLRKMSADGAKETVITVTDKSEDGETIFVISDYNDIKFNDTIADENGAEFTISAADSIEGVFIANTGAPTFRVIRRQDGALGKDYGGYVVLSPEQNPRIKPHDRIVLDAGRLDDSY